MPVICWSPRSLTHRPAISHVWYGVRTLRRSAAPGGGATAPHAAWALGRSAARLATSVASSSARGPVRMTSSAASDEWERVLDFWFHQGDMRESFRHKWFPSGADNMQVRSLEDPLHDRPLSHPKP